ncbi:RNA-directed DNA polymerase (reverse transcriptase)-related family protein, partial [Thalictrum thalictroides]
MHHASKSILRYPKQEGGLGFSNLNVWNRAAICGLILKIANKDESIWAEWTWNQHIKDRFLWSMKIPKDCSWAWRKILQTREDAIKNTIYSIADGSNTLVWHDPWCRSGLLNSNIEARQLLDVPETATVNMLIDNGEWNSLVQDMPNCSLKLEILNTEINSYIGKDRIIWMPSPTGLFSSKSAYEALRKKKEKVTWHSLVWGKMVQPKQSFSCWQLFTGSLPTQDRLRRRRIITKSECIFCKASRENSKHLFFDCPFSKNIWASVKHAIGLRQEVMSSTCEWNYILRISRGKSDEAEIVKAMVCATVSNIWKERNWRRFRNKAADTGTICHNIINQVKQYIQIQTKLMTDKGTARTLT